MADRAHAATKPNHYRARRAEASGADGRVASFAPPPRLQYGSDDSQQPEFWDDEALANVIAYEGNRKQVWYNTEIGGPG